MGMMILAVSGGVDSVVLLDKISKNVESSNLIIAHVDHGVRENSSKDASFVQNLAKNYDASFELKKLNMRSNFSEEQGRIERYRFFEEVRQKYAADCIVTAHHKDDVIETAVMNLVRGTGRRGLSSLGSSKTIKRPLVGFYKEELLEYAKDNKLEWVEDSTNIDTQYFRNKVRLDVIPELEKTQPAFKEDMLKIIEDTRSLNREIDTLLARIIERLWPQGEMAKDFAKTLEDEILVELILMKARDSFGEFYVSRERLESAVEFIKNKTTGKQFELNGRLSIFIEKTTIKMQITV